MANVPPPPEFGASAYGHGRPMAMGPTNINPHANIAMWLTLGGMFCLGPVLAIPALIFGLKGMTAAKELGGDGNGKSTFAVVASSVVLVAFALLILVSLTASAS